MRKAKVLLVIAAGLSVAAVSCKAGSGCRGNGRNVGAERLLAPDKKTAKEIKKAGKFRS
jgi:hypothetical protein